MVGLYIYFLCICVYNPIVFGINLSNFVCIIGFCSTLVSKRKLIVFNRKDIVWDLFLIFYGLIIVSVIISNSFDISFRVFVKFLILFILVLWINLLFLDRKNIEKIWDLLFVANLIACSVGLTQSIFGIGTYHLAYGTDYDAIRLVGSFPTPNIYANFLCLTLPIVILRAKNNKKILLLITANMIVLYRTYSRSSIFFIVISIIIWLIINHIFIKKRIKISVKNIVVVFLVFIVIYYLISTGKLQFLFRKRHSNTVRMNSYLIAFELFKNNMLGRGIGIGISDILDGSFFNIMVDLGFFGLIVIFALAITMFLKAVKIVQVYNTIESQSLFLSIIVFWLLNIFENIIYDSLLNPIMAIIICELYYMKKFCYQNKWCVKILKQRGNLNESTIYK